MTPNYNDFLTGLSGAAMMFILFIIIGALIVRILFLLNLHKTLEAVSPENRKMEPGLVWLALIPIFYWIWHFFIVTNISESLKNEFQSREIQLPEEKPAYNMCLAYSILSIAVIVPFFGGLAGLAALVFMIIYWVKTSEYKNKLNNM